MNHTELDTKKKQPLFRKQALSVVARPVLAPVSIVLPPSLPIALCFSLLAVIGLCSMLFVVKVPVTIPATGVLMPEDGLSVIKSERAGIVQAILLEEGMAVQPGAALLTLMPGGPQLKSGPVAALQLASLDAEWQLTHDAFAAEEQLRMLELEQSRQLKTRLQQQKALLSQRERHAGSMQDLSFERLQRIQALHQKGYIAVDVLQQEQVSNASIQNDQFILQAEVLKIDDQLDAVSHKLKHLQGQRKLADIRLMNRQQELQRAMNEMNSLIEQQVVIPREGIVSRLLVKPGDSLSAGQPIAILSSDNTSMIAELYVSAAAARKLSTGQVLKLSSPAYPKSLFGTLPAVITEVSQVSVLPHEINSRVNVQGPVYAVKARLTGPESSVVLSEHDALSVGAIVNAEIYQAEFRLYQWLNRTLFINHFA